MPKLVWDNDGAELWLLPTIILYRRPTPRIRYSVGVGWLRWALFVARGIKDDRKVL